MEPTITNAAAWFESDTSVGEIVVTENEIKDKIAELGQRITQDYSGRTLLIVGVL